MKVIAYGDNCVDRYINKGIMFPGGNCINFAVYARQLGMESSYLGLFGDDKEAELIRKALKEKNVDFSRCRTEEGSVTERCDISLTDTGNRVFEGEDERENIHDYYPLEEEDLVYLSEFDLIHCSCFAEEECEIHKLESMPGIRAYDFSEEDEFRTEEYLDEICPFIDFALFSCEEMSENEMFDLRERVSRRGVQYILFTMGPDGQCFYADGKAYVGKAKMIKASDTMGAGDSFFTAFLVSLLKSGWNRRNAPDEEAIYKALKEASDFAASNCLVDGAFGCGEAF